MVVDDIVKLLGMEPHPEGGYYKRSYIASDEISLPTRYNDNKKRPSSTCIYYLLGKNDFSAWHRIKSDEIWHHYEGATVTIFTIDPKTHEISKHALGKLTDGAVPQVIVKHGLWFCASLSGEGDFGLCGCTVSPGFDFRDFELADRSEFVAEYPEHETLVQKYTKDISKVPLD